MLKYSLFVVLFEDSGTFFQEAEVFFIREQLISLHIIFQTFMELGNSLRVHYVMRVHVKISQCIRDNMEVYNVETASIMNTSH
jgi:hypothetical protein